MSQPTGCRWAYIVRRGAHIRAGFFADCYFYVDESLFVTAKDSVSAGWLHQPCILIQQDLLVFVRGGICLGLFLNAATFNGTALTSLFPDTQNIPSCARCVLRYIPDLVQKMEEGDHDVVSGTRYGLGGGVSTNRAQPSFVAPLLFQATRSPTTAFFPLRASLSLS